MPRRFFRKIAKKREYLLNQWYLAPFSHLLHDPRLWSVRRRNVVPAFALGLFITCLPFPGHMLIAALLALALRVNIPVAAVATIANNPLTAGPIYYGAFQLGELLLGLEPRPFDFELSFAWLADGFIYIWQPLLLGCVLVGAMMAFIGYVGLDLLWRWSIAGYLAKRRARAAQRDPND
jgi:hypothetical protein